MNDRAHAEQPHPLLYPTQLKMASSHNRPSGSLERFRLEGISDTCITVGDGTYATILQYDFHGLKCVGKKIHRLLYEHASPAQRAGMLQRFEEECDLLGRLHHPNIVQFLGVHMETGSELPVLVMEYLPTNLSGYLNRHGVLPNEISYSILRDVALGLRYLHEYSPPIVHRDLSANNVLLTASLSAKISDLGVAKILNIMPCQTTQRMSTRVPGTPCYMPPEVLIAQPTYTRKIDSYSFGVMVLHVLCGEWPFPTDVFQRDPHNPGTFVPVTEVDRRAQFMQKIGCDHPLSGLVCQCLSNTPDDRPESADILQQINTALSQVPAPAETVFQQLEGLRSENQRLEHDNQRLKDKVRILQNDNLPLKEHSQKQTSSSGATVINQPLIHDLKRLSAHDLYPVATNSTEPQLHPEVRLQWRKCADAPVGMTRAHIVVVGEKVYVGGGKTGDNVGNAYQIFQYNWKGDMWSTLPDCPVQWFGMAHFMGRLITVGGEDLQLSPTGEVYALREESQQWEEFLTPMPTARYGLSVATTSVAIIAAGGHTMKTHYLTLEVYSSDTSQWHTPDDPLYIQCAWISSVIINNTYYILGGDEKPGIRCNWYAFLPSLVLKAISSTPRSVSRSVWTTLQHPPVRDSTVLCLNGSLVAVGGLKEHTTYGTKSPIVYALLNNFWVKLTNGDLPSPRSSCATAQLSPVEMIVIGGFEEGYARSKSVFIATLHSEY